MNTSKELRDMLPPMLMPHVETLDGIFSVIEPWEGNESRGCEHPRWGTYCYVRTRDDSHKAYYVNPTQETIDCLEANTISISNDKGHFIITQRDDGTSLISWSYGLIIGSKWLTMINA